jgi:hypothetical protein
MATSPSTDNYSVLKGTVTFDAVDLGNVSKITLTPSFDTLDHFSSRSGVKSLDKQVVVSKKLEIALTLDEWSESNVRLAILGSATGTINIFALAEREGELIITGTNEVGQKYVWTLPSVSFKPSGSLDLISDEWATMEITGTVNLVADSFGTVAPVTAP